MQTRLTLTSKYPRNVLRPEKIAAAIKRSTLELEANIKNGILRSKPGGKTYRLNAITKRESGKTRGLKLKTRGTRQIVGYNFHRASRAGQPPAILTGRLMNSIRGRMIGKFTGRVSSDVVYANRLDDPNQLNRPFFRSQVQAYRARFIFNIRNA